MWWWRLLWKAEVRGVRGMVYLGSDVRVKCCSVRNVEMRRWKVLGCSVGVGAGRIRGCCGVEKGEVWG